jgi:hypothetical protein
MGAREKPVRNPVDQAKEPVAEGKRKNSKGGWRLEHRKFQGQLFQILQWHNQFK